MMGRLFSYALAPLALAGTLVAAANATDPTLVVVNVRQAMQEGINLATMAIWDVGNNAMSEDGGIDPGQMTPETWAQLESGAQGLKDTALAMYNAEAFVAADASNAPEADSPGAVSMEAVQRHIDENPEAFRAAAKHLADHADLLIGAAQTRDAQAAGDLVAQLDQVCEVCHSKFWYPEQNVLARN